MHLFFKYGNDKPNENQTFWELFCHVSQRIPTCQNNCNYNFSIFFKTFYFAILLYLVADTSSIKSPSLN